ncbi:MAG: N-acetylneuraminate synthase [Phycisphaerales bacterium]|nr:N-acetylneuraminate synthase [Phycisphaerales bacterium]
MNGMTPFRFDELERAYLIAEIGINHNGDVEIARRLMDMACLAEWDCVKFQKRDPDRCVPNDQRDLLRDTPWGRMTYLEYRRRLEFNKTQYHSLWKHAGERIAATASVWDENSVDFMLSLPTCFLKIPSAHLTNDDLIRYVCRHGAPILLSTGMSTLEEVDHAVELLQSASDNFAIMHCHSSYPAAEAELNLRVVPVFIERYGCVVGYSGHEFGLSTTVAAVALGARIIERHVTLKRTMWGTDQMASVEPHGMLKLAAHIRALESSLGDGHKRLYDSELPARRRLRGAVEACHA